MTIKEEQNLFLSYFKHLTERLDKGTSKSPILSAVVNLCKLHGFTKNSPLQIIDIGCFSGSMLNRILMNLPDKIRPCVSCVGVDENYEPLILGSRRYPTINFTCSSLKHSLPFKQVFHIAIISNVLHELFSAKKLKSDSDSVSKMHVQRALAQICQIITPNGYLVIEDGVMPSEPDRIVLLELKEKATRDKFIFFSREFAFPTSISFIEENLVKISLRDLSAFMTKAKYFSERFWPIEATQVYQFMTKDEFHASLTSAGMVVQDSQLLLHPVDKWASKFALLESESYPPKSIFLLARKAGAFFSKITPMRCRNESLP